MTPRVLLRELMPVAEAAAWATEQELRQAQAFGSEHRRREFLTWRAVVRQALGREVAIGYNAIGAPLLLNSGLLVAVSHCADRVAVVLSPRPCAVDVEMRSRDFERVAARYLSPQERLICAEPVWLGVAWCAKETLYKYAGQRELDLLTDLRLTAYDPAAAEVVGQIKNGDPLRISVALSEHHILTTLL